MSFLKRAGSEPKSVSIKRRYPIEYKSWLRWEVGLPVASPAVIFFLLLFTFLAKHADGAPAKALISISGSGDLLILSALLLINIGAKFRILDLTRRGKRDFESGDFDPDSPFFWAMVILLIYIGVRVALETYEFPDDLTIKFTYGTTSVVILLSVVLWIDNVVCQMHTRELRHRLDAGLIESQYNQ